MGKKSQFYTDFEFLCDCKNSLYLSKCLWKAVRADSSVTCVSHIKLDQALASVSSYILSLESSEQEEQHRNQFCERELNTKLSSQRNYRTLRAGRDPQGSATLVNEPCGYHTHHPWCS